MILIASKTAYGPVADFQIKNGGQNYYSLPGINTITTEFGSNAVVSVGSSSIGRIKKTKIQNIGFNFPSDTTLRPTVALPQVMQYEVFGIYRIYWNCFSRKRICCCSNIIII